MQKYAIVFDYNMAKEYFIPYSQEALLEEITDKRLRSMIEASVRRENAFEHFVEKYNLQEHYFIERIDDMQFGEDSPHWINETEHIEELSLWDFLADAKAISEAQRYGLDNREYVNRLASVTLDSRRDLHYLKLMLSVLVYIDGGDDYPDMNGPERNGDDDGFAYSEMDSLMREFFRDVEELEERDFDWNIDLSRYENFRKYKNFRPAEIAVEVCELIYELEQNGISKVIRRECKGLIKKRMTEVFRALGECYTMRLKKILALRSLYSGRQVKVDVSFFEGSIYRMSICMDQERYTQEVGALTRNLMESSISSFVNCVHHIGSVMPGNYASFDSMRNFFGGNNSTGVVPPGWAQDKYETGDGCFALLISNSTKHYFAFSGAKEVGSKRGGMENLAKVVMENILNHVTVKNVYDHIYTFNWAYLHDASEALRYTEITEDRAEDITKYILQPEKYADDLKAGLLDTAGKKGATYGCCERKMLAFSGYKDALEIYSRWAPCWMCRPAVMDAQPCDYYAFADLDDKKRGMQIDMQLKKYTVSRRTTYSVSG